jgi:hypothetical protein
MENILNILKYFGYSDPIKAYKSISMDKLMDLIHKYYILNPMKT